MLGQQTVSGRRTVLHDAGDFSVVENEARFSAVVCSVGKGDS